MDAPAQIVFVPDAFTVGIGLTVMVTVRVPLQLPVAPVTVYVVVTDGLAIGLATLGSLNPVAGNHE